MKATVLAIVLLTISVPVLAQDPRAAATEGTESAEVGSVLERLGATVTLRAGVWSSSRGLDSDGPLASAMFWGKVTRPIGEQLSLFVEGWATVSARSPEPGARTSDVSGDLREAFATYASGPFELRAGRQIIAWGRADGINPTDVLSGQDLTMLAPDDSDRRLGAAAARFTYTHRDVSLTAIWLPEFRPHHVPLPPIAGPVTVPGSEWRPEQYAVRIEQTGRAIDWSASAFSGRDLTPDLKIEQAGGPMGQWANSISLSHRKLRMFGADAAGNVGRYGLRAEAAYVRTEDESGTDPFVKNPFIAVVAGGDRSFREHMNVNVQYLYRYVMEMAAEDTSLIAALNNQARSHQHGASARVSYKWLHDTLEAEVAAAGYAAPRGGTIRPKITYALTDHMKLLAGGEVYRGKAGSAFQLLRENSGAFAEMRWSF